MEPEEDDGLREGQTVLSDEQLWSWVDREAPELEGYIKAHPEAQERVDQLRGAIGRFESADPVVVIPDSIGQYKVQGLLGRGGMGLVYDALEEHPKRRVALKVLPAEFAADEKWLRRFRREADALAMLSHSGIASIFGVGRGGDGRPHIAMEMVAGLTLGEFVKAERPGRRERLVLAHKLCEAVGHAHDHGVVHRDLKPANVIVHAERGPVVLDFGLAQIEDEEWTQVSLRSLSGALQGTLPYMSPEQVAGKSGVGARSDVYSLGVVLFELITGRMPYDLKGLSLVDAARQIQERRPKVLGMARLGLRGDLRTVVLKALEKDPKRRFASAGELAADLQRCLDGRPIEATRASLGMRVLRTLGRHWVACGFLLSALVVSALLVMPYRIPIDISGSWLYEASPFEDVRWVGDTPQVRVEGQWFWLVEINGLKSGYVIGFCQQAADEQWRKRFSEDLVEVLHRLGEWRIWNVDLVLRDLDTGGLVRAFDVKMTEDLRQGIARGRRAWPWANSSDWEVLSIDGWRGSPTKWLGSYDDYCDVMGRSPGELIDFEVRDLRTGTVHVFKGVNRVGTRVEDLDR